METLNEWYEEINKNKKVKILPNGRIFEEDEIDTEKKPEKEKIEQNDKNIENEKNEEETDTIENKKDEEEIKLILFDTLRLTKKMRAIILSSIENYENTFINNKEDFMQNIKSLYNKLGEYIEELK